MRQLQSWNIRKRMAFQSIGLTLTCYREVEPTLYLNEYSNMQIQKLGWW